jgi:hypothetical protein
MGQKLPLSLLVPQSWQSLKSQSQVAGWPSARVPGSVVPQASHLAQEVQNHVWCCSIVSGVAGPAQAAWHTA